MPQKKENHFSIIVSMQERRLKKDENIWHSVGFIWGEEGATLLYLLNRVGEKGGGSRIWGITGLTNSDISMIANINVLWIVAVHVNHAESLLIVYAWRPFSNPASPTLK